VATGPSIFMRAPSSLGEAHRTHPSAVRDDKQVVNSPGQLLAYAPVGEKALVPDAARLESSFAISSSKTPLEGSASSIPPTHGKQHSAVTTIPAVSARGGCATGGRFASPWLTHLDAQSRCLCPRCAWPGATPAQAAHRTHADRFLCACGSVGQLPSSRARIKKSLFNSLPGHAG
jgi:hypothetical protein